jgi:chromosome segregation ATPase
LENYNEVITTINNKLAELTTVDENNKTEINETIQSLNEQITTNINQNKETSDEEIDKLKRRCSLLEKELFGDIALPPSEEAEEDYSSIDSRFDTLDEQLKTITDALKRVGIIKEE